MKNPQPKTPPLPLKKPPPKKRTKNVSPGPPPSVFGPAPPPVGVSV